ncbi:glycosyl transferase [Thermacetogenium phaeum DSM 12270]|uniref:Glycosyl transferase n=1 Tax=Thermacetogenium phaeum (strain ATCC BAA-254 / DSM 26808 / PB) TaxID=1089553 RepID=K4LC25_THEPS|nr:glycosyltransferase [Thermacetogenium phaeum]AFV10476.1 glycosyl transferase [Thermacetogenium phaeum DSM 12270]
MNEQARLSVVHIIGGGEFGGAEQHVLRLTERLGRNGCDPHVVCLFREPFYRMLREAGIPAAVVPMRHRLDWGACLRLASLLRELRPQIVHTHGVRSNLIGRLAARLAAVPVVVTTVHSVLPQDYPSPVSRLLNGFTERVTSPLTTHFIAVSGFIGDYLAAAGIPREKITVIYNGIDPALWESWACDGSFRTRFGIPPEAPLFGIVARLHPVKGHRYFLEAAREVAGRFPDARFVIVGSGFYWREVDSLIREYGLADRCIRTGFLTDAGPAYAALDCLVISSLSEGFGLTALEAAALGKPVIATRVGALPEIIEDGVTGLLVPPADPGALARAMLRLLEDPAEGRRLGAAAREVLLERFSLDRTVAQTAGLYRSLLEGRG